MKSFVDNKIAYSWKYLYFVSKVEKIYEVQNHDQKIDYNTCASAFLCFNMITKQVKKWNDVILGRPYNHVT